jgi:hypothetical protein
MILPGLRLFYRGSAAPGTLRAMTRTPTSGRLHAQSRIRLALYREAVVE